MTILRLPNISDTRLRVYNGLTNHQLRNALDPKRGIVIVESEIAIRVALAHGVLPQSLLLDENKVEAMQDVLAELPDSVPVFVIPPEEAQKLTGYRVTRGALSAMTRPQQPSLVELLRDAHNVIVLEGITDTANVGSIFRNAAAFGADAVIVAPTCADPLSRRAVRVSMGNVFLVPWMRMDGVWQKELFDTLHHEGFTTLALALDENALDLRSSRDLSLAKKALFFGSEGSGLTDKVLEACDRSVIIPMSHGVDSLNVAASSAVAMWELF